MLRKRKTGAEGAAAEEQEPSQDAAVAAAAAASVAAGPSPSPEITPADEGPSASGGLPPPAPSAKPKPAARSGRVAGFFNRVETIYGLSILVVCSVLIVLTVDRTPASKKIWNRDVLALYNGDRGAPLHLAVMGEVFDVTKGKKHYGKGGYEFFLGKDASRAYVTGDFKQDLTDRVSDFTNEQCASLIYWRDFFRKTYDYKGRLVGRFYDSAGKPTGLAEKVEAKAALAKSAEQLQREAEAKIPACNVRWTDTEGSTVWCDDGMHPRRVVQKTPGGGEGAPAVSTKCLCFKEVGWSDLRQIYEGCTPDATKCSIKAEPKAEPAPGA